MRISHALGLALVVAAAACGKVKDPTPPGATLFAWDRSQAKTFVPDDVSKAGGPHPLASATILEGPKPFAYRVTVHDSDGKDYAFDLDVEAAKVSYPEGGADTTRWATTKATARVAQNDAYHLTGTCDDRIATEMGAPGEVTNTVLECRVTGKRPNSLGTADAITYGAFLQIDGSGKILSTNDPSVTVASR